MHYPVNETDTRILYFTFMKKRTIITMVLVGILGLAQAQNNSISDKHLQSVIAISRVLGDGRKVETVVLQYDTPIDIRHERSGTKFLAAEYAGAQPSCPFA